MREGSLVKWESSGGTAYGKVSKVVKDGTAKARPTGPEMAGSEDDPAYEITLWTQGPDGEWLATDTVVVHRGDALEELRKLPENRYAVSVLPMQFSFQGNPLTQF